MTEPARWYHLQGERQLGPLELDTMRRLVLAGTVGPDTYVWSDGMAEWYHARDVPALVPPASVRAELPHWGPAAVSDSSGTDGAPGSVGAPGSARAAGSEAPQGPGRPPPDES